MVFNATALLDSEYFIKMEGDHLGRDGMVVEFTTTSAISAYHDYRVVVSFEPRSWLGILDTTLYDKICQWLATGQWFSLGTPASSTIKTDRHNIILKYC